ncbi:TPA: restriction endonuclease subunit S, partial [Legionella pneumophila]|nr:restriction endonuclease subunit S [Legionella pneumophila]
MNSTQYVKLRDCCDVVGGSTPKRNIPEYWLNEIPWVTPKDISSLGSPFLDDAPEYISEKGYKSCSTFLLPKNSILLTTRAPIGNVAITGREMCTNQGFKSLVPHSGVDFLYIYYCIKHHSPKLQALGNGATFKEISKKIVEDFEIPLPSLEEQKRISAILAKADEVRRNRQQSIELSQQLLRSVFLDMFGDPISNPKGWKKTTLENVCRKITDGTHHSPKLTTNGIHYITARHIKPNQINFDSKPTYISIEDHKEIYSRCNPEINDVLYIKDGATTGIAAINPFSFEFSML